MTSEVHGSRTRRNVELLLFIGLLAAYNINLRQVSSHDTYASRFVPISILRDGDLILDEFVPEAIKQQAGDDFFSDYFVYVRGHFYDSHPPVGPLLALPVYALPAWIGIPARAELIANMFSKLAASLMVALSGVLIFRASRQVLMPTLTGMPHDAEHATRIALLAAIAYGLATGSLVDGEPRDVDAHAGCAGFRGGAVGVDHGACRCRRRRGGRGMLLEARDGAGRCAARAVSGASRVARRMGFGGRGTASHGRASVFRGGSVDRSGGRSVQLLAVRQRRRRRAVPYCEMGSRSWDHRDVYWFPVRSDSQA